MSQPAPTRGPAHVRPLPATPRAAPELDVRLRHLAFHGHAEHVRALFGNMTPAERARHADPQVLRQAALGSLARVQAFPAGDVFEALREREFLESIVRLYVSDCCRRGAFPRELFRTLLDWAEDLARASRLAESHEACRLALTLGAATFPDIWPWIQLQSARAQMLLGDVEGACTVLLATCRRLDRISDRDAVPALLEALGIASLQTRRAPLFKRLLADRLRVFHTNVDERRTIVGLIRTVNRGTVSLLVSRELTVPDKLVWLTHWALLGTARHAGSRAVGRWLEKCDTGSAYLRQYAVRRRPAGGAAKGAPTTQATLVTRAMGGIGDFLMMTPGLRARRALGRRPPVLAIPRRFFPLFAGNDDVELVDIDADLDPAAYGEWFNLTDCPAARVESRTAPAIKANRIELFARGLGITGRRLKMMDRRPRYVVSDAELEWRDRFFRERGLDGLVVGVQPHTDEAYRDVPHMREIVEALLREASVLVFGHVPVSSADPRLVQAEGLTIREAFALAGGCDVLVTPDSAFFHLAGALDLPCVGLFGPTDGRVRGHDYPRARTLDARRTLACVPCWRNEATGCALTGMRPSACLGEIAPADVVLAVRDAAATTSRRRRVAD